MKKVAVNNFNQKGETKMKIDFTQVLKGFDGKPLIGENKTEVTLGFICVDALLTTFRGETEKPNPADVIRRYEFAKAIDNGEEMDLKAEDIVLLKGRILKSRPTLVYGLTSDMLEKKEDVRTNEPTEYIEPGDQNI